MPTEVTVADMPAGELLDVGEVAKFLKCSPRHVFRMSEQEKMPPPVRLGALVRWSRSALLVWISAGCPACTS